MWGLIGQAVRNQLERITTMSQTNLKVTETTEAAPEDNSSPRGVLLPCPCCGEEEVEIALNLSDLHTFTCTSCATEFSAAYVRDVIAKWSKVLRGLDAMAAALAD
jgi:transposase-like protein